jgi:hypothetical protein
VIAFNVVGGLLVGGLAAAPLAAWLVQKVAARLLGALVGGFILLTNARTIFAETAEATAVRGWTYAAIVIVWIAAVALVVRAHRRDGSPLLNGRQQREAAFDTA